MDNRKIAQAKYYSKHKEKIKISQAQYRRLNRAELNARQREKRNHDRKAFIKI